VEAGGVSGTVRIIGIFTTTLTRPDNIAITIPNSSIWGQTITNYAANETRRVDLVMGISYDDNIQTAIDTMMHIMRSDQRVLADPEPTVAVSELADSSVNLVARSWCKRGDYGGLRSHLMRGNWRLRDVRFRTRSRMCTCGRWLSGDSGIGRRMRRSIPLSPRVQRSILPMELDKEAYD